MATYHTPAQRFREVVRERTHLRRLDAVVVVSTVQQEYFESLVGRDRVFYVPHGVDAQYFQPGTTDKPRGAPLYICVGQHLRDFRTLAGVAERLAAAAPGARIAVVAQREAAGAVGGLANVDLYANLSDEQLRHLYQGADALLLPLLDSTANNALLEGMACGLPVVSTDLAGVRDYVSPDSSLLSAVGDVGAMTEHALAVADNPRLCARMGAASRTRALELDWAAVAEQMRGVYQAVAGGM